MTKRMEVFARLVQEGNLGLQLRCRIAHREKTMLLFTKEATRLSSRRLSTPWRERTPSAMSGQ